MYIQNVRSLSEILIKEGDYIKAGTPIAMLTYNETKLKLQEQTIKRQIAQLQAKPIDSHSLYLASQKVEAKQREYKLQQEIFKAEKKLYATEAISKRAFDLEEGKLAQKEAEKISAEEHFQEIKKKLLLEEKGKQYQIDQALLQLKAVGHEREGNKIYSQLNAKVLLIRTHTIHNNNMTIAIKLLVNAPEPPSEPIPKQQIEPPTKKQKPTLTWNTTEKVSPQGKVFRRKSEYLAHEVSSKATLTWNAIEKARQPDNQKAGFQTFRFLGFPGSPAHLLTFTPAHLLKFAPSPQSPVPRQTDLAVCKFKSTNYARDGP